MIFKFLHNLFLIGRIQYDPHRIQSRRRRHWDFCFGLVESLLSLGDETKNPKCPGEAMTSGLHSQKRFFSGSRQ